MDMGYGQSRCSGSGQNPEEHLKTLGNWCGVEGPGDEGDTG
jgi:hypothetical protein